MKKFINILCAIAAISTLFSCEKAEAPKNGLFEITVGSDETKTHFTGAAIHWNIGDKISLFHAVSGSSSYVNDGAFTATANDAITTFTGVLSETLTASRYDWYAVYPYTAESTGPDYAGGIFIGNKPGYSQHQSEYGNKAHLTGDCFPLYGNRPNIAKESKPFISMQQMASVAKIIVTNNTVNTLKVNRVELKGSNYDGTTLCGKFVANTTSGAPSLSAISCGNAIVTIDSPADLAPGQSATVYVGLKPFTVNAGDTVTIIVSTNMGNQSKTCDPLTSAFTFVAGDIHTFNFSLTNPV